MRAGWAASINTDVFPNSSLSRNRRQIMRRAEENPYRNRAKQKLEQCRKHTKDKRMTWQQGTEMQSSRPGGNSVQRERNPNQENAAPGREKL
jgi:hypothetical protein